MKTGLIAREGWADSPKYSGEISLCCAKGEGESFMRAIIRNESELISEDKSLLGIETSIQEALLECDFWGELSVSRQQYEYLCDSLRNKRNEKSLLEYIDYLFVGYPACVVTTMIFFIVFEYKDEFWIPWNKKLGIESSQRITSIEGRKMLETLKRFNMEVYEDDGYKYLTPIICQAGVPDSNLDDLFYALTLSDRFDAHELIAEFKGWRSGYIKKPLERFIRLHENNALDLVVLVHDVMMEEKTEDSESYEGRIYNHYGEWKKQNLNKKGVYKGKGEYQEIPILVFDDDKGLCMSLPEYFLKDDYCEYIKWTIGGEFDSDLSLECDVFNDGNRKHSLKKIVPVKAKDEYYVRVYDPETESGDRELANWKIDGLTDQRYLLFKENGKRRTDDFFSDEGGTLIVSNELSNVRFSDVFEMETAFPNSEGIRIYQFLPEKSTAQIHLRNDYETVLSLKKSIKAELNGGSFLFGDPESGYRYPIYTSVPVLKIEKEDGQIDQTISLMLRNRDTGYKKTITIDRINVFEEDSNSVSFDALRIFGDGEAQYGRYSLKIYVRCILRRPAATDAFASGRAAVANGHPIKCFPLL